MIAIQCALFVVAVCYAVIRQRYAPIVSKLLWLVALIGLVLSFSQLSWIGTYLLIPVAVCVLIILEKNILHLQRQVIAIAQHIAISESDQ